MSAGEEFDHLMLTARLPVRAQLEEVAQPAIIRAAAI